jgi:YHS domain-containing protein
LKYITEAPVETTAVGAQTPVRDGAGMADVEGELRVSMEMLLRKHAPYFEAAFLNSNRRAADAHEFHEQIGGVVQRLQRLAERDGNKAEAARLAGVLVAGLTARRGELDYDIFAMGKLSRAHRDLADYAQAAGDVQVASGHLAICADPARVPYPDRECMIRLAEMAERGVLGPAQDELARELRARAPHYAMKRFTVPIRVSPGAPTFPFNVYIPPPLGYDGIDHMVRWLQEARGLQIPSDVVTSFRRLHSIARENNVSFPDLAVYALGEATRSQQPAAATPPTTNEGALRRVAEATATGFRRSPRISTDEAGIALRGFDVVAFFQGGAAQRGTAEHFVVHGGAIWLFASAANAETFRAEPERYLPQFGGFCAGCILEGTKTHANPVYWAIVDGRLYLHSSSGLRDTWRTRSVSDQPRAQAEWNAQRDTSISPAPDTEEGRQIRALRRN